MKTERLAVSFAALALAAAMAPSVQAAPPRSFVTHHEGTFGTTRLAYDSVVEEFILQAPSGKDGASVFATSYLRSAPKKGAEAAPRPVVFVFNGGPGSASLWLHMGLVGPERVDFDDVEHPQTTAPFHTQPNGDSILDVADIVLIDPPGTGWSRILPDGNPSLYYGVDADAAATVSVMEQWLARHDRLNAPKFLLSESYGTIRAAVVAKLLAGGPMQTGRMDGVSLNGVILLGQAMNMDRGLAGDDRPAMDLLPTLAATACHFHKVAPGCTPEGQVDAARAFIEKTYLAALYQGSRLGPDRRKDVAAGLSALTGLPEPVILANDLRLTAGVFGRTLLEAEGKRLGQYDARFTLPLTAAGSDPVADDPAMGQYVPGYVAAWDSYARQTLKVTLDLPYQAIAFREVNGPWDYGMGPGIPAAHNFATDLATAMNRNPALRVMVGAGLYDLVTPLGNADSTMTHAGIPLDRVSFHSYRAGHMAYIGKEAHTALVADLRAFVSQSR